MQGLAATGSQLFIRIIRPVLELSQISPNVGNVVPGAGAVTNFSGPKYAII